MKAEFFPPRLVVELSSVAARPTGPSSDIRRVIAAAVVARGVIIVWISLSIGIHHFDICVDSNIKATLVLLLGDGECATEAATSSLALYHYLC